MRSDAAITGVLDAPPVTALLRSLTPGDRVTLHFDDPVDDGETTALHLLTDTVRHGDEHTKLWLTKNGDEVYRVSVQDGPPIPDRDDLVIRDGPDKDDPILATEVMAVTAWSTEHSQGGDDGE